MSFFIPYSLADVLDYFSTVFSLDVSSLTSFEKIVVTILSNLYFFGFWFFVLYFVILIFNRIWERLF